MQCGNEELPTSSEAQKWPSLDTKIPGSNRILSNKKVGVELINPWRIAFELKEKVGLTQNFIQKENAPKEGDSLELQISLARWDEFRTFVK